MKGYGKENEKHCNRITDDIGGSIYSLGDSLAGRRDGVDAEVTSYSLTCYRDSHYSHTAQSP